MLTRNCIRMLLKRANLLRTKFKTIMVRTDFPINRRTNMNRTVLNSLSIRIKPIEEMTASNYASLSSMRTQSKRNLQKIRVVWPIRL
jgi:hypothetical protein